MESKPSTLGYKIVIGLMAVAIVVLAWMLVSTHNRLAEERSHVTISEEQKTNLQSELDSLVANHEKLKLENSNLTGKLSSKDSIIQKNATEIRKLINSRAELTQVKKKLEEFKRITKGYESQIDSLQMVTRQLRSENEQIKIVYQNEQRKNTELSKEKEDLTSKISAAKILKAYKITAVGLRSGSGKERETDKASSTEKIKVCFTISENKLITEGYERLFVRIARPGDNLILTRGSNYTWTYKGEIMQFSSMETLNYEGEAVDVCTYFEKPASMDLPKGRYFVTVFTQDREIGEGSFELK